MATKQKKAPANRPYPAEVKLTVTRFIDVLASESTGAGRGTTYLMKLTGRHPLVYIKSPGATLRFTLASTGRDKETYFPVGITFVRQSKCNDSDEQRLGFLNFAQSQTRPEGRTLSTTYRYKNDERDIRYKFSLVVQRGSDGRIGLIDPAIEHDNSD